MFSVNYFYKNKLHTKFFNRRARAFSYYSKWEYKADYCELEKNGEIISRT